MPQDLAILLDPEHAFPAAPGPFSDDDDVLDALVLLGMKQAGEIASSSRPSYCPRQMFPLTTCQILLWPCSKRYRNLQNVSRALQVALS
jgi:hypothetical protein